MPQMGHDGPGAVPVPAAWDPGAPGAAGTRPARAAARAVARRTPEPARPWGLSATAGEAEPQRSPEVGG